MGLWKAVLAPLSRRAVKTCFISLVAFHLETKSSIMWLWTDVFSCWPVKVLDVNCQAGPFYIQSAGSPAPLSQPTVRARLDHLNWPPSRSQYTCTGGEDTVQDTLLLLTFSGRDQHNCKYSWIHCTDVVFVQHFSKMPNLRLNACPPNWGHIVPGSRSAPSVSFRAYRCVISANRMMMQFTLTTDPPHSLNKWRNS